MSRSLSRSTIETFQLSFWGFLAASPSSLATTSTTETAAGRGGAAGADEVGCVAAGGGVVGACGPAGGAASAFLKPSFWRMLPNRLIGNLLRVPNVGATHPTIIQPAG